MNLETERSFINILKHSDKEDLYRLYDDQDVWNYLGGTNTAEYNKKNFENKIICNSGRLDWTIRNKVNNSFIGCISLTPHHDGNDIELSYMLLSDYWGKGFASEAVREVVRYAFDTKSVNRLVAETQSKNINSCNLLEKLGFYQIKKLVRFNAEQILWAIDNPAK